MQPMVQLVLRAGDRHGQLRGFPVRATGMRDH